MSMTQPMEPNLPGPDDGIPAADAGAGAPPPAEGFGIGGAEPDVRGEAADGARGAAPQETPFRTPDPTEIGPAG